MNDEEMTNKEIQIWIAGGAEEFPRGSEWRVESVADR